MGHERTFDEYVQGARDRGYEGPDPEDCSELIFRRVKATTAKAVLLEIMPGGDPLDTMDVWLPRSQIVDGAADLEKGDQDGSVEVADWLLEEKDLA